MQVCLLRGLVFWLWYYDDGRAISPGAPCVAGIALHTRITGHASAAGIAGLARIAGAASGPGGTCRAGGAWNGNRNRHSNSSGLLATCNQQATGGEKNGKRSFHDEAPARERGWCCGHSGRRNRPHPLEPLP